MGHEPGAEWGTRRAGSYDQRGEVVSGKKSREKGHRFERALVQILRPFVPDSRRGNQAHNPRECDVEGSQHFRIEAKHWKRIGWANIRAWCEKMVADSIKYEDTRIPIGVAKVDQQPEPIFFAPLSSLLRIQELLYGDQREDAEVVEIHGDK